MKKKIALGIVLCIALALGGTAYYYFVLDNYRVVEAGGFYGSAQMTGAAIERAVDKWGIKTMVNFRGENKGNPWYEEEVATCKKIGLAHYDFGWSKNSIPDPESLSAFLKLLHTAEKPFLVHCQGGTHRTGVAAACYLLMKGESVETARGQFGPGFMGAPIGELLTLYEGSSLPFEEWVNTEYPAKYEAHKAAQKAAKEAAEKKS